MARHKNRHHGQPETAVEDRVRVLEGRVSVLEEALRVLTHGLEDLPAAEPGRHQASSAARQAHDLLLAEPQPGPGAAAENG